MATRWRSIYSSRFVSSCSLDAYAEAISAADNARDLRMRVYTSQVGVHRSVPRMKTYQMRNSSIAPIHEYAALDDPDVAIDPRRIVPVEVGTLVAMRDTLSAPLT